MTNCSRVFTLALALVLAGWLAPSPGEAASVQSVQTGTATMDNVTTQTVPITTADPGHAFVVCSSWSPSSTPTTRVTCEPSATAVTITSGAANTSLLVRCLPWPAPRGVRT